MFPLTVPEVYAAYDFGEPWDGPNNRRLIARMPDIFRCPTDSHAPAGTTNYVAVVGNETAWPFTSGHANAHSRTDLRTQSSSLKRRTGIFRG